MQLSHYRVVKICFLEAFLKIIFSDRLQTQFPSSDFLNVFQLPYQSNNTQLKWMFSEVALQYAQFIGKNSYSLPTRMQKQYESEMDTSTLMVLRADLGYLTEKLQRQMKRALTSLCSRELFPVFRYALEMEEMTSE